MKRGRGQEASKIVFVAESFPSNEEMSGGVNVSVRRQAEFLSQGYRVVVFAPRIVFPTFVRYSKKMKETQGNGRGFRSLEGSVRIYRPLCFHVPLLWRVLDPIQWVFWLAVICSILEREVSLIHAHRCFLAGFAACLAAPLLGRRVVLTAYGSDVNSGLRRDVVGLWVSVTSKYALKRAAVVISVSNALAGKMESVGIRREKIRVIPSGVETSLVKSESKEDARRKLGLPKDVRVVLLAANLVPVKDPLTMVRAFVSLRETVKDVILVILGNGELEQPLRREIARLLASDFILLEGRRPRGEIPLWLAACDVVTLSSLDEGCPVIVLEGFVSGKPFVGTAVGGVPEVVTDDGLGVLVEPSNPASLARALKIALEKEWDRERLVRHGLNYSWEAISRKISEVYADVERMGR